jgi:hypothetical protein
MELVRAVNAKLATLALEPIADASVGPSVCEGRTGLDHIGSATLAGLGELAGGGSPHLHLLHLNPYRLVYVPRPLDRPAVLDHHENLGGRETAILMGASAGLRDELLGLAPSLGIPLEGGALSDEVAKKIDDLRPLHEGEDDWHLIEKHALRVAPDARSRAALDPQRRPDRPRRLATRTGQPRVMGRRRPPRTRPADLVARIELGQRAATRAASAMLPAIPELATMMPRSSTGSVTPARPSTRAPTSRPRSANEVAPTRGASRGSS